MVLRVPVQVLAHGLGLELPAAASVDAAGLDLRAAVEEPITLGSLERALVPTGLVLAIPRGFEGQVRPRSGLAWKQGLTVANAPGTIDADYRGEVKVILVNLGREPVTIVRGMRVAQLVIAPVTSAALVVETTLDETDRGVGGFGSTGS
ncbi:MAG: dUTP diphosphatase [Armatimonadetes bacterium]|nr:dUTP diphosphatase [Armatimonadota bacterium]